MTGKNDGGPAFPVPNDANVNQQEGMALRDYFATHVIAGVLAHGIPTDASDRKFVADHAYLFADAMLESRK